MTERWFNWIFPRNSSDGDKTQVPLEKSQANYEKETQNTFFLAFSVFWKLSSVRELLCYVKQLRFVYIRKYDKVHMGFGLISVT